MGFFSRCSKICVRHRERKSPAGPPPLPLLEAELPGPHKATLVPRRSMRPSTSEPAVPGVSASAAGSTAGRGSEYQPPSRPSYTVSPAQDSASNAAAAPWEPRKPLGGTRKPRRSGVETIALATYLLYA